MECGWGGGGGFAGIAIESYVAGFDVDGAIFRIRRMIGRFGGFDFDLRGALAADAA